MGTTQPIREKEDLEKFLDYYLTIHPSKRNYLLIVMGLNTALRISDILNLKWENIYDMKQKSFRSHLIVTEKKTGKKNIIALNSQVYNALREYSSERTPAPGDYIFTKTTNYRTPLCRSHAFRIVKKAAEETLHVQNISCHSLRKTFGYHAWKQGTPPALLMDIYNHSSYLVTKKYLGINQDEKDSIFLHINL